MKAEAGLVENSGELLDRTDAQMSKLPQAFNEEICELDEHKAKHAPNRFARTFPLVLYNMNFRFFASH
jgi:hypothetical protein